MADLQSATETLKAILDTYGLGSLSNWAVERYDATDSFDTVLLEMRQRPEYKERFRGMEARRKNGFGAISENDYISWEDAARTMFKNYGLPATFYDSDDDMVNFIAQNISPAELEGRIKTGYADAIKASPAVRDELQRLYGVGPDQLAAFFIDPDRGAQAIQDSYERAKVSGIATDAGFGRLSLEEATALQNKGITGDRAQEAFDLLGLSGQILGADSTQEGMTREQQLALARGEAGAQTEFKTRQRKKVAAFEGGGGYAASQEGIAGLGSS